MTQSKIRCPGLAILVWVIAEPPIEKYRPLQSEACCSIYFSSSQPDSYIVLGRDIHSFFIGIIVMVV
jgi:hypothetical protein